MVRLFYKIQFREVYKLLEIILFGFLFSKRSFVFFLITRVTLALAGVKLTTKESFLMLVTFSI
jgi:hypothetical protein